MKNKNSKSNEEKLCNNIKGRLLNFCSEYKIMFIMTIIVGVIAHGFMLANKLPNHDDLESTFTKGVTFKLGRWGLELLQSIFPNISMPWLNGLILIILVAISACLVAKILGVKSKVKQCLIGTIMVTYTSITCTMAYMFTASSYGVAILLSVLSVYFAVKMKRKTHLFLSIVCLIFSLSIYQAYIGLIATLFIILLIKDCINKEEDFKKIIFKGLKFLAILIIASLIYLITVVVINYYTGNTLSDYQGANEVGNITIKSILSGIANSYMTLPRLVLRDFYGLSAGIILKIGYAIALASILILAIMQLKNISKVSKKKTILYILLALILPISMNLMYVISSKIEIHSLMLYGNCFILILPLVLLEEVPITKIKQWINKVVVITLIFVSYKYVVYANECYFELKFSYENTYAFYNTLVTRIESTQGFDENSKIAFIGQYSGVMLTYNNYVFDDLNDFTGIINNLEMINAYSKERFILNYIGVDFKYASETEINDLKNRSEVQLMEIYPFSNSIKKIDDYIVVKFSDESIYLVN